MLAYQRDPRYLRFYPRTDRTEAEVRDFVHMFVDQQAELPQRKFQLAITLSYDDQRAIDSCRIRLKPENEWEAAIGYELAPEHWGEGYATEAALAIQLRFSRAKAAPRVVLVYSRQRGVRQGPGEGKVAPGGPFAGQRVF